MSVYEDRQQAGKCVYGRRCDRPLAPDSDMCERHLKRERRRKATAGRAARANNRALGLCAFCPRKSATYRCAACAIKHGQTPTPRIAESIATPSGQTDSTDQWRRDGDGWERYRGKGHRGAPSAAINDEQDLRAAIDALEKGRQALLYAHSDEVKVLGRHQRREARAAAASILRMAARFLDEVVERNLAAA